MRSFVRHGSERRILEKTREGFIVDRLYFRNKERRGFADPREQIVQLSHAREVFRICAVLGKLEGGVVVDAFDF